MDFYTEKLENILHPSGFEISPFKIGWYNERVADAFRLSYPDDTLAYCIISTPSMFEKLFLPFVDQLGDRASIKRSDPVDSCVAEQLQRARKTLLPEIRADVIQDFEVHPVTRRPKLLVQTAGHVSGAAYYYKRDDVTQQPWPEKKKIYGVSIHPRFGGWFAFRGAIILKDVRCVDLPLSLPRKLLSTDEEVIDLLERFNFRWKDNTFRDVIEAEERYSTEQVRYWDTPPAKRFALLGLEDRVEPLPPSGLEELIGGHS